jgi:hypothetical protein
MVSLADIAPVSRVVPTSVGDVEVWGLSGMRIADLILRFPLLRNLMTEGDEPQVFEAAVTMVPGAVAAVVAAATHQLDAEANIDANLPVGDQIDILMAVGDLTMPKGIGPLVQWLGRMTGQSLALPGRGSVDPGKVQDTISQS